jgi:hypothetical protein
VRPLIPDPTQRRRTIETRLKAKDAEGMELVYRKER